MRVVMAGLVVVVLAALGGGAWYLFLYDDGREEAATAAADAFVAAWSGEDWDALASATTDPTVGEVHATAFDDLGAVGVTVRLTELDLTLVDDGIAAASYQATYDLGALGEWTHVGAFEAVLIADAWQVAWEPSVLHPEFQAGYTFRRTREWPERAPILGPDGEDLVGQGDAVVVGIEPQRVDDPQAVVDAIDELTPASGEDAQAVLDRDDLRPDWFYPVVTMARPAYDAVRDELRPVPGLVFQETTDRLSASQGVTELLGRTGEITAEQLEQLGAPYETGDIVGRSGLEVTLERRLAGEPGGQIILVDAEGDDVATLHEVAPTEPEPVRLTLDVAVQEAAAAAFEGVEQPGGIAVVDVASGAVRAAVSRPADGFARALTGQYAPGSTFKVVTAAAMLAEGIGADDTVECPGEINAGGRVFGNAGDLALGSVDFTEAFARSCNTTFIGEAAALPEGALQETAALFGFGDGGDSGHEVAGRRIAASFPAPSDDAEQGASAIGQGRITASPLQMASVAATATTGVRHPPFLLAEDASAGEPVLSDDVVASLSAMMRAVVTDGTGQAVTTPGVVGKTGTAQAGDSVEHAWFIGAWEGLAFAVLVEDGGSGGGTAAPIAQRFLEALGG